jgi:uncharacterized protein (TIGR02453 family)
MNYFSKDFLVFLEELKKNNNREWFNENKSRYEKSVKKPFEDFISDLIFRIKELDEDLAITPKEAIFRIYRDVRFSNDKSPYKTHVSAIISNGGRKDFADPGNYVEINSDELRLYGGIYQMNKEQLYNVRNFIQTNLNEFELLINDKEFTKYFGNILGEQNKVLPLEFKETAMKQPLIANKQFYFFAKLSKSKILSKSLPDELIKLYKIAKPVNMFLKIALEN